ncbi:hypothetical protein ACFLV1_02740 [Chloroflexota bacterium]
MAFMIVAIMIIVMAVFGGMTVSQGYMTTTDRAATGIHDITLKEGQIIRTEISPVNANNVSWANILRVRLENSGQVKLASFSKWDVIAEYYDASGNYYTRWLPYNSDNVGDNQWSKIGIYVYGKDEVFEPGILNPGEEMVIGARLTPPPGADTTANIIIATQNGIQESNSFPVGPGFPRFVPHSESRTIAATDYYYLQEGAPADGANIIATTPTIAGQETGRWLLHNAADASRLSKHVSSLAGVSEIPAATWTAYYHAQSTANWTGPACPSLSIDIVIRKADGSIRDTLATDVAEAVLSDPYDWQTISAAYSFPGYTVVDDTDYLEIDYYGKSSNGGPDESSLIQLSVDDSSLSKAEQTRIEA